MNTRRNAENGEDLSSGGGAGSIQSTRRREIASDHYCTTTLPIDHLRNLSPSGIWGLERNDGRLEMSLFAAVHGELASEDERDPAVGPRLLERVYPRLLGGTCSSSKRHWYFILSVLSSKM